MWSVTSNDGMFYDWLKYRHKSKISTVIFLTKNFCFYNNCIRKKPQNFQTVRNAETDSAKQPIPISISIRFWIAHHRKLQAHRINCGYDNFPETNRHLSDCISFWCGDKISPLSTKQTHKSNERKKKIQVRLRSQHVWTRQSTRPITYAASE